MNASYARDKLLARINREFRRIKSRCIYIDTVQVLVPKPLSSADLALLRSISAPGIVIMDRSRRPGWFIIRVHQPSRGSLNFLAAIAPHHIVNRVDFALDLVVEQRFGALRLQVFLSRHLRQLWHGDRKTVTEQNTIYFDRPWNRRNIAMYASRPSKVTGTPCSHLDFRFYSAAACKRIGVRYLPDLQNIDVVALIQRNCRLSAIIPSRVDARIKKVTGNATLIRNRKSPARPGIRSEIDLTLRRQIARLLDARPTRIMQAPVQLWFEWFRNFVRDAIVEAPDDTLVNKHQSPFLF